MATPGAAFAKSVGNPERYIATDVGRASLVPFRRAVKDFPAVFGNCIIMDEESDSCQKFTDFQFRRLCNSLRRYRLPVVASSCMTSPALVKISPMVGAVAG